ncbi:MAG: helix-turn-helix transcriptional regulator [Brevundimonas sp.]
MEPVRLTVRESECLQLAIDGLSDRLIADRLNLPIRSVTSALHRAYNKLGVSGRAGAARAIREGYTADTRTISYHPEARFAPAPPAATAGPSSAGARDGSGWWRPPPRGWLNRTGLVLGLGLVWLLLFAGALPALLNLLDGVHQWWLRGI